MFDLTLVNKSVCEALRIENNEIVYRAWLFFTENAQLVDGNIIVSVPNYYTKNIIEERYLSEMEELYRNKLDFNKFIIKASDMEEVKVEAAIVKESSNMVSFGEQFSNRLEDIVEIINTNVRNIYDFIEDASRNGSSFVSYTLTNESAYWEEIYSKVKEFMLNKGFKVELNAVDNICTLNLSW